MSAYEVTELAVAAIRDGIARRPRRTAASPGCEIEIEPSRDAPAERGAGHVRPDRAELRELRHGRHTGVLDAAVKPCPSPTSASAR
jgi:hypothetical protein